MKLWKKIALSILSIIVFGGIIIYLYLQIPIDLRTDYVKQEGESIFAQQKGRRLLEQSLKKIDSTSRWREIRVQNIQITFQHFWYHDLLKKMMMPVEKSGDEVSFFFKPAYEDVRLTFLDGQRKGTSWGIQNHKAYKVDDAGGLTWGKDWMTEFHLPSYRFFLFLPFYLAEAELITYAGDGEIYGNTYDFVYATWGKWTPQRDADQYLIWINRETMTIDYVQSTVRAVVGRSITTLSLSDYREVLGLKIPFSFKAMTDISTPDEVMHYIKLTKVERLNEENAKQLFPVPKDNH